MSLYLADVNGYLADVGSCHGYNIFIDFVERNEAVVLLGFIRDGFSEDLLPLREEVSRLLEASGTEKVQNLLETFQEALKRAEGILIISS